MLRFAILLAVPLIVASRELARVHAVTEALVRLLTPIRYYGTW
jgi:hypothetical protein